LGVVASQQKPLEDSLIDNNDDSEPNSLLPHPKFVSST